MGKNLHHHCASREGSSISDLIAAIMLCMKFDKMYHQHVSGSTADMLFFVYAA